MGIDFADENGKNTACKSNGSRLDTDHVVDNETENRENQNGNRLFQNGEIGDDRRQIDFCKFFRGHLRLR